MQNKGKYIKGIFEINSEDEFNDFAIGIFRYQYKENSVYRSWVDYIGNRQINIKHYTQIPFLPIEFFKTQKVYCGPLSSNFFMSSGTTSTNRSKHFFLNTSLYKKSFLKAFNLAYGNIEEYVIIALMPKPEDMPKSSLVFMTDALIKETNHKESGFYLSRENKIYKIAKETKEKNLQLIILGLSYALADFAENFSDNYAGAIIMETGGMKGRRKELPKEELHTLLRKKLNLNKIHSEYGMTELFSQAYSKGDGQFLCPPWMKVLIRDVNDPLSYMRNGKTGGVNVIDLANMETCSFIATHDLGKRNKNNTFEILGRFDYSELRGCNLMI